MITSADQIDELIKGVSIQTERMNDDDLHTNHENSETGQQKVPYDGDYEDKTATPIDKEGKDTSTYQALSFEDGAELINFFYEPFAKAWINPDTGKPYSLHKWQDDLHKHLAAAKATSLHPHKFCLVAANGSGKDAFIVAPFAIWFALTKIQSRVIITSSSGNQLTAQTEHYIKNLAELVNKFFGCEIFRIRQRYIKCRLTGSEVRLFATDEAGKAEGYHPIVPGAEMAIIVNEGKTVTDEIHNALRRCTGYNYWIEVSTPGEPTGFFYRAATSWPNVLRITSYDCPHLSEEDRDEDKRELGEHSALFRSKHLALFTSIGGEVIITSELVEKLINDPPQFDLLNWPIRIGIDLAAGGDENALCFSRGIKCIKEISFRETDTTVTADRIEKILMDEKISKDHEHLYADDGGVGHAIIDMLVRRGWNIKRILNQWQAINKKQFGNRGAENWYRCKRILEEGFYDVSSLSEKTRNQLITRHYKQTLQGGRIQLESKKEAKAHGRPSPDRADAYILSLTGLTIDDYVKATTIELKKDSTAMTADQMAEFYKTNYTKQNRTPEDEKKFSNARRVYNSLRNAIRL